MSLFQSLSTAELHVMLDETRSLDRAREIAKEIERRECLNRGIKPAREEAPSR